MYQSLKGLFTIGTDDQNRSVKVSLEFIETETDKAVKSAAEATTKAEQAAEQAATATTEAQAATKAAQDAKAQAETATADANKAATDAGSAAGQAEAAAQAADAAAEDARQAKEDADAAAQAATEAKEAAETATAAAEAATETVLDTLDILVPTGLKAECVERLTIGNVAPVYIKTELTPETAMKNLIFISDNKAVEVSQDGRLTIVGKGYSRVHVIPTCNTALARSLLIEVGDPTARLVKSDSLRLMQSGAFRFN